MAASATSLEYVQKMFLAYFGRPVAPTGQEYYAQLVDAGNIAALQDDFWNSAESQAKFGSLTTEGKVNAIFNQLFGRDAAVSGLTYWTTEINAGRVSLPVAALTILNSASAADLEVFNAKLDVANAFTAELDTTAEILAYQSNLDAAVALLAGVKTAADADAVIADISNAVADVVAGGTTNPGQTFMLTAGNEEKTGGNGNDIFTANSLTWDQGDIIHGGGGTDSFELKAGEAIASRKLQSDSVETISVTALGGDVAVDLIVAEGVETVTSKNSLKSVTFSNLQSAAAVVADAQTANDLKATYRADLAGAAKTANVTVKGGSAIGTLTVSGADGSAGATAATKFGTLALTSAGTAANSIAQLDADAAHSSDIFAKVTVAGAADLTLGSANADVKAAAIDASTFTGKLAAYVGSTATDSVTGGSGDDTITLSDVETFFSSGAGAANAIDGKGGNNTLVINGSLEAAQLVTTTPDVADHVLANIQTLNLTLSAAADTTKTVDASIAGSVTAVTLNLTNTDGTADATNTTVTGNVTNVKAQAISATGTASTVDTDSKVALAVTKYDGAGATDVAALTLAGAFKTVTVNDAADDTATTAANEAGGIESVAITAGAANLVIDSLVAQKAFGLTLAGAKNVKISDADLGATNTGNAATDDDLVTVAATGLTGNLDFTKSESGHYVITTGSGTNAIRLGANAANTTVVGNGTETVYITEVATTADAPTLTNVEVVEYTANTTSGGGLSAANFTNVGKIVVKHGSTTADDNNGAALTNLAAAQAVEINSTNANGFYGDTLTLNAKTGVTALSAVKLTGTAALGSNNNEATLATNAASLSITNAAADANGAAIGQDFKVSGSALATLTLAGNGNLVVANGATAPTIATLTASNNGNLDVSGLSFDTVSGATVTTGATTAAATTTVAAATLANGVVRYVDTAGTDTLVATGLDGNYGFINVSGYETLDFTLATSGATSVNLRDASGYTDLVLNSGTNAGDEGTTIANIASGSTVQLKGTFGDGADTLSLLAKAGTADTLNLRAEASANAGTHASATVAVTGFETLTVAGAASGTTARDLGIGTLSTDATTLTVGGTAKGAVTLGDVTANSATSIALNATGGAVTYGSGTGTTAATAATSLSITSKAGNDVAVTKLGADDSLLSVTGSGDGAVTVSDLGSTTALATVNFSGNTGNVVLGTAAAALTLAASATVATGEGNDTITLSASNLVAANAGEKTADNDTLILVGAQNSGVGIINLNAAGDQVVNFNGAADSKVQTGFESIDLSGVTSTSGYGFTLTANDAGSTIVGSQQNDVIYLGAKSDVVVFKADGGSDTINGFTVSGTGVIDKINVDALTTSSALDGSKTTANADVSVTVGDGNIYLVSSTNAGDADTTAAAASLINGSGAWGDGNNGDTMYFIVTDNNSTAVYKWVEAGGIEIAASELTLVGTIDAVLTSANLVF